MDRCQPDVLVAAAIARDEMRVEELVVVGDFAAHVVRRDRVAGNAVGICLDDARPRCGRVAVGVVRRSRGGVVRDVVEECVIDAQRTGRRDAEPAVRCRIAFDDQSSAVFGIPSAPRPVTSCA